MFSRAAASALALGLLALPAAAQIRSSGLDDVNAWSTNLLDRGEGAVSDRIWASSDTEYIISLMQALDVSSMTEAEQALLSRTLRSPSVAPRGGDGDALQLERLKLLSALGERRAVAMLGRQVRELPDGADPDAIIADDRLASGELDLVCSQMDAAATGKFWSELRIVCALNGGSMAEAELALELAAGEEGADPWVTETAIAIIAEAEERPDARLGSGLQAAFSAMAELDLNGETLQMARPDLAAEFAADTRNPLRQRIVAARRAAEAGLFEPERLRALYIDLVSQPDFEPESDIEAAFALLRQRPEPVRPPELQSLQVGPQNGADGLWPPVEEDEFADGEDEAEDTRPLVERQASAVAQALESVREADAGFATMAGVFYNDLKSLPTDTASQEDAVTFARAALAAGNGGLALYWLDAAEGANGAGSVDAQAELMRGYALLLERGRDRGAIEDITSALLDAEAGASTKAAALRLFAVWAGFDVSLPVEAREALVQSSSDGQPRAGSALVGLDAASRSGAHGEAILVLLGLTSGEPEALSPAALQTVIAVLRRLGADEDARALALETAGLL